MAQPKLILYSYFRSSCSYRVRIALAHKGLDYEYRSVHLLRDGGEQHRSDYKKTNPMAQVPSLIVDDGEPLAQSLAIIEYLDEKFPEPPLLPKAAGDRARVRQMAEIINSGVQPLANLAVLQAIESDLGASADQKNEWARRWISQGFQALESLTVQYGRKFCFGDSVTLADLCLVPQVYNAQRVQLDMSAFPKLQKINEACLSLDAFQKADPAKQPDAQSLN